MAQTAVFFGPLEFLEQLALDGGGRERQVGARQALRHSYDVWLDAVVLMSEFLAGPSEAADHLVDD